MYGNIVLAALDTVEDEVVYHDNFESDTRRCCTLTPLHHHTEKLFLVYAFTLIKIEFAITRLKWGEGTHQIHMCARDK